MKILYNKDEGIALSFPVKEIRFALVLLKAIYKAAPLDFVKNAIDDIERDLQPKLLPVINYWHWCKNCGRDINEKDDNTMCITRDGDVQWQCRVCKPLKYNRPK